MDVIFDLINGERAGRGLEPAPFKPEKPVTDTGVSFRMIPTFEEKVLEHKDGHYIVQDWMGAITEISDEYDYTCPAFLTSSGVSELVRNAQTWVTKEAPVFSVNRLFGDISQPPPAP